MTEAPSTFLPATITYPVAERLNLIEHLHGRAVADPYRWLEDANDPRTGKWSAEQDVLTRSWLDAMPGRERLGTRLRELMRTGSVSTPTWRAGRAFFTRRGPEQDHPVLYLREQDGTERVLLDVSELDPSGRTTLDGWSPSPEGTRLAYQVSVGGNEHSLLHVVDVDSGELIEGPIDRCRYSPIGWLPGGEEFFYVRQLDPAGLPEDEKLFHRRVWRHRVGADPATDVNVHGDGLDHTYYYGLTVSQDGRWLVVNGAPGTVRRDSVWIADLHGTGELKPVISADAGAQCSAFVARDGMLYVHTSLNASRFRICVADPERPTPEHWVELVGEEPDSVLDGLRWLDGRLVVLRTRHAVSELHLHSTTGDHLGQIPLPGTGSVHGMSVVDAATPNDTDALWVGWTDFVTPLSVYRFSLSSGETTLAEAAPGRIELPAVTTQQISYASLDGTTVRMFVVSGEQKPDLPRPTLLTGYGGFAIGRGPGYSATTLAWVEAGGVWVHVSLRGGDEEGEEWHHAGMRERKQNVFDDFHSAAERLVRDGWTTPQQLAIMGGSNGGLLVGAALTQRPELYAAVVCSAPLLDMVRYEKFLLGRLWAEEYGSASVSDELGWLLSYSPYHRVRPDVEYPSVLFTVFESDSRVDPNHARKMCAALQHASTSDPTKHPVLIRRETEVGHAGRSVSRTVALAVDQLTFLGNATGMEL